MRALMIVAALFCAAAGGAAAQSGGEATPRDRIAGNEVAPPPADNRSLQNACIVSEVVPTPPSIFAPSSGYTHSFYLRNEGDTDTYRVDVTDGGLRLNSATQVGALTGSPSADTRFNVLIETLRAAAASRSKFRIDARNTRVTQVIVAWNQRCD
ncbi:hypothetical protein [Terricaulis silvestris]|uniref:Uncharacterized protein n=1 Tax=Terricaulis silvestris TaxID=2686094 RepID=A0A6I6MMY6_9CAUL|nr:hypothetical protein [Terricaulis silvestris]QGZ94097.1 hypothetical protein DSM104635_00913 [Terricaulis silvestris]